jgi:hypothetical protein
MKTLTENLGLVLVAKTIKGTSFVGIKNYEKKRRSFKPNYRCGNYLRKLFGKRFQSIARKTK